MTDVQSANNLSPAASFEDRSLKLTGAQEALIIFLKEKVDTPFVKSDQIGDPEYMAIRCWEKKYNVNRDNYRAALIVEYKLELKMKEEL